jgi:DNA-binding transcriptional LysR family regulator
VSKTNSKCSRRSQPGNIRCVAHGREHHGSLEAVREKQPALKLDVRGDFRQVDLGKGEADIAVRMVRPTETDLVGRRTFETGWCKYSSITYAGTRGTPASFSGLGEHQLVLYDETMHGVAALVGNASGLLRVFPEPITANTGWVVYHEAAREKARVRAAVDALVEFFEAHTALFSGHAS